ncbi:Brain-specific homeobox protein like protein [Myotis brandtii]|uniref:Brain-specific homeobox protein like protein n=1 Tax=Myotis brandtii TaxID=109478 RepID=S7Q4F8_MYOBR|nr:Brain-specific homeobox protein like protein [Myotis brandtii]
MNLNFTSPLHPASSQRPTSFFIEDILLHKPKPLREVPPDHFASSLASRVPLLDYGYPLMPTPTLLAPHPHHPLHKGDHHHPYFLTTSEDMRVLDETGVKGFTEELLLPPLTSPTHILPSMLLSLTDIVL